MGMEGVLISVMWDKESKAVMVQALHKVEEVVVAQTEEGFTFYGIGNPNNFYQTSINGVKNPLKEINDIVEYEFKELKIPKRWIK